MLSSTCPSDPWMQTIGLLKLLSGLDPVQNEVVASMGQNAGRRAPSSCALTKRVTFPVKVVERPDPNTLMIAWCDPTSCHYGDQIWGACLARNSGVCAISGMRIRRGDAIYRPRTSRLLRPVNADAMILFSVIDHAASCSTSLPSPLT
ncbi:uncharacterized protein DUF3331 [Paraburkholderia sp. BL23I1N1]|nr:uncharacterized protein DUF3331 [Paraburkholderia sp. BL23I1N1]